MGFFETFSTNLKSASYSAFFCTHIAFLHQPLPSTIKAWENKVVKIVVPYLSTSQSAWPLSPFLLYLSCVRQQEALSI
jgi:hypothetical protein